MNNYVLVLCVFFIGYGWGATSMLLCFWAKAEKILEHCTKVLKLQKDILESNDSIQGKMISYSELIKQCYDTSYEQTGRVIQGLGNIVKAVEAEEKRKNGEMQIMRSRDQMDQNVVREVNASGS